MALGQSYVGYAYENGLTKGLSDTSFGSAQVVSEAMFLTYVLRALGYDDAQGDFNWASSREKGIEIGIIDPEVNDSVFLRDHSVGIAYRALSVPQKDKKETLRLASNVMRLGTSVGLKVGADDQRIPFEVLNEAFGKVAYHTSVFSDFIVASTIEDFYIDLLIPNLKLNSGSLLILNPDETESDNRPYVYAIFDQEKTLLAYAINPVIVDGYMWFETKSVLEHSQKIRTFYEEGARKFQSLTVLSPDRIDYNKQETFKDEHGKVLYHFSIDLSDYNGDVLILPLDQRQSAYDFETLVSIYLKMETTIDITFIADHESPNLNEVDFNNNYNYNFDFDSNVDSIVDSFYKNPRIFICSENRFNLYWVVDTQNKILGYMVVDSEEKKWVPMPVPPKQIEYIETYKYD